MSPLSCGTVPPGQPLRPGPHPFRPSAPLRQQASQDPTSSRPNRQSGIPSCLSASRVDEFSIWSFFFRQPGRGPATGAPRIRWRTQEKAAPGNGRRPVRRIPSRPLCQLYRTRRPAPGRRDALSSSHAGPADTGPNRSGHGRADRRHGRRSRPIITGRRAMIMRSREEGRHRSTTHKNGDASISDGDFLQNLLHARGQSSR